MMQSAPANLGVFVNRQFRVNFLIVGAQKSGTSALAHFLSQHPEICHSPKKELHFFDSPNFNDAASREEIAARYRTAFPNFSGELLVGESTPIYLFRPEVAARIHRYNPEMKLILLLRDPVARAISQYYMAVALGRESRSMGRAFVLEQAEFLLRKTPWRTKIRERSYLARGFYTRQILNLLRYFGREQILILRAEELATRHREMLLKVYQFLGVRDASFISHPDRVGRGDYPAPTSSFIKWSLRCCFTREIRRLERMLGWDLNAWRQQNGPSIFEQIGPS